MTNVSRANVRFRCARCLVAAALVALVSVLASIMVGGPKRIAQAQTPTPTPRAWSDHRCLPSNSNCTANEGGVSDVYEGVITSRCEEAPLGFIVGTFFIEFGTPNTDRYDYGIFLSEGDPIVDDTSSMCFVEALHPTGGTENPDDPSGTGPFRDLEFGNNKTDACGDVSTSDGPPAAIFLTTGEATIPCVDNDLDGFIEIDWCFVYDNNRQDNCWDVDDIAPGTPSKCDCGTRNTTSIPIGVADLEITKETLSQTLVAGPDYTYDAVFEIRVQNTGVRDLGNLLLTDDLEDWIPAGSETYSIVSASAEIVDSSYAFGTGRSCTIDDNTDTGTMSYDGTSDIRLTLPDTSCLGRASATEPLPGDYVVFQISVRFTTTCAADYTNTATVSTQPRTGVGTEFGGTPLVESATSHVVCSPLAVDSLGLDAQSGRGRAPLLAVFAILTLTAAALLISRRDSSRLER